MKTPNTETKISNELISEAEGLASFSNKKVY